MKIENYDLNGKPFTDDGVPPIVLIKQETDGYVPGWYYTDECETLTGPFETLADSVNAYLMYFMGIAK